MANVFFVLEGEYVMFVEDQRTLCPPGTFAYVPRAVPGLFDMAAEGPADTGNYQSRILPITHVADVATATVAEEGCWGTVSFLDFFSLCRIDGTWKIVNKTFAHVGGEPPARPAETYGSHPVGVCRSSIKPGTGALARTSTTSARTPSGLESHRRLATRPR